jgi:hypothetical protein
MGYDSRAVKIHKTEKIMALLSFDKERERHLIREFVKVKEQVFRIKNNRTKNKDDE